MKKNKVIKVALSGGLVLAGLANVVAPVENIGYAVKNKDGVCEAETKDGSITFTSNSTTVTTEKPLDLILILDGSNSFTKPFLSGDTPQKAKITYALEDAEALVNSLPEGSQVMFGSYYGNTYESYSSPLVTKLVSKQDALSILGALSQSTKGTEVDWYRVVESYFGGAGKGYVGVSGNTPYEDAYQAATNKLSYVSVVQFTDEWESSEDIDTSFANWSKTNAKTFMSILYPYNEKTPRSYLSMTGVGHPNVYNARGDSDATRKAKILETFKNTATERQVPSANIEVIPDKGITLKAVKLVDPNGKETNLAITDNKVKLNQTLDIDGDWQVKVVAEGLVPENSKVLVSVSVSGGTPVTKEITFEGCKDDVKGTDEERTTENINYNTTYVEDENLHEGVEEVRTKGVIGVKEILKVWQTVNGQRVGEPTVTERMLTEVVDEIIARGTQVKKEFTYRILDANDKEKVLVDTTKVSDGYKGDAYKLESLPTLEGYEVVVPEGVSLEGVFNGEAINVDLVAYKLGDYAKLSYLDEQGNPIKDATELIAKGQRLGIEFTGKVEKELKVGDKLYRLDTVVVKSLENKGFDKVVGLEDKGTYLELKGNVVDDTLQYVAHYKEVKVAPVKVKFVDENGKELQKEVNLLKEDSKLDGDYSFTPEKRIKVGNDEYAFVGIDFDGRETKEIKGKFGERELSYTVKYKKVVKPAPQKLPKTSADNNSATPYAALSSLLGLLGLGFLFRKTK